MENKEKLIGKLYKEKKKIKGTKIERSKVQDVLYFEEKQKGTNITAQEIADQYDISELTIRRAEKYLDALETIAENVDEKAEEEITSRQIQTTKTERDLRFSTT